jgi:excisionase family DNA binding protein
MTKDPKGWAELPVLVPLHLFCEWTGLSRNTVQKLAREGEIATTTIGKQRRYRKAEIARLGGFQWRASGGA